MKFFTFPEMGVTDAPEAIRQNVYRLCTELLDRLSEGIARRFAVRSADRISDVRAYFVSAGGNEPRAGDFEMV